MRHGKQLKVLSPQIHWCRENEEIAIKCYIKDCHSVGGEMIVTSLVSMVQVKYYAIYNVDTLC